MIAISSSHGPKLHLIGSQAPLPDRSLAKRDCVAYPQIADKEIHGLEMLVLPVWLGFSGPGMLPYKQYEVKFSVRKGGGWQCQVVLNCASIRTYTLRRKKRFKSAIKFILVLFTGLFTNGMFLLKSGNIDLCVVMLNVSYCVSYSLIFKDRALNTNFLVEVKE